MKKLYILIFSCFCLLGFAQNPLLFNKNWKIEKVVLNNSTTLPPDGDLGYFMNFQTTNSFSYYSKICAENSGNATYSNSSQDFTITLTRHYPNNCTSTNISTFDTNYSLFFTKNSSVTNKINYSIDNNSAGYKLTLTNVTGDQIVYNFYAPPANLSTKNWVISSLNINGVNYNKPSQHSGGNTTIDANGFFQTSYFNSGQGSLGFFADNKFRVLNLSVTLADSFDPEISQFDALYFDNFFNGVGGRMLPYSYNIINGDETLIITKHNGDTATYFKKVLSTSETSKSKISVYPNPTTDIVIIENLKPNSSLELIDNSGKLVKSISTKISKTEINIKNLASGIYYLKVDGQSVQKIIKK